MVCSDPSHKHMGPLLLNNLLNKTNCLKTFNGLFKNIDREVLFTESPTVKFHRAITLRPSQNPKQEVTRKKIEG